MIANHRRVSRMTGDDGAALVEGALMLPILMTIFLGLFDFGTLELRQSQVSSAARDGARTGLINWTSASTGSGTYAGGACPAVSVTSSASYVAICTAVVGRLAGTPVTGIEVRCLNGLTLTSTSCTTLIVVRGTDLLEVSVSYTYSPTSIAGRTVLGSTYNGKKVSRMVML
jgi:Flp pilus assembly protein TadG